jgi:glycerol-3-phosphate cytidylyltransferase
MKTGLIFGCFDFLHIGHINILKRCKQNCDKLIVGVCNDKHIIDRKQKQPLNNENDRLEIIKSLKYVDDAFLVYGDLIDYKDFIINNIDILFAGDDHKDEKQFIMLNKETIFFPYTKGISTTQLREKIKG